MTSIIPLQNPHSAKSRMRSRKVKSTFCPPSVTNIRLFRARCGSSVDAGCSKGGVCIIAVFQFQSLECDSHLRADDYGIINIASASGIDHILNIGLKVTPGGNLNAVRKLEDLLRLRL